MDSSWLEDDRQQHGVTAGEGSSRSDQKGAARRRCFLEVQESKGERGILVFTRKQSVLVDHKTKRAEERKIKERKAKRCERTEAESKSYYIFNFASRTHECFEERIEQKATERASFENIGNTAAGIRDSQYCFKTESEQNSICFKTKQNGKRKISSNKNEFIYTRNEGECDCIQNEYRRRCPRFFNRFTSTASKYRRRFTGRRFTCSDELCPKFGENQPSSTFRKDYFQRLGWFWVGILWAVMFSEFCLAFSASRTVRTKYGDVAGVIVTPDSRYLDAVEVFKGVPYASPPVGKLRFMPPVTGAQWSGVKMANHFSPVCPQRLPDLRNETAVLARMPRGRLEHLRRILPYLSNQSEDCLYLNVYAPAHADLRDSPTMFPVLVYIHGDSYEWGSGSLYDGTVLSSYGGLVVVTMNYRLGILGFLNSNADPHQRSPSNYGLMDQVAALHWIQENIAFFGGDPRNVTLMGHGTGAACVHFLMTSTAVPEGALFHRAILMSGSALCPWALVRDPAHYTRLVALHAGCPVDSRLLQCLRERPLEVLLNATAEAPQFLTAFGPSVDGVIIGGRSLDDGEDGHSLYGDSGPIHFHNFLNLNNPGFRKSMVAKMSRYDLLLGMVKLEAYFSFTADDVQYGIEADRKAKIMRTFVKNTYRYHLSEILATIVNEYTDWDRPIQHPINIRDETMDALSDAMVVAPMVHTADLHSSTRAAGYMYVFDYQSRLGDFPQKQGCVHGEELPYVFGAPLVSSMLHFPRNYTKTEVQLSEMTMDYWTNFIKTGNPNQGTEIDLPLGIRIERHRTKNMEWLTYDKVHKRYLYLDMKPKMKNHYRAHRLSFWLNLVPDLHHPGGGDVPRSHHQLDNDDQSTLSELDTVLDKSPLNTPSPEYDGKHASVGNSTLEPAPPVVVVASSASKDRQRPRHKDGFMTYPTALSVTITVGCSLLILNILVFILVFYQRDKRKGRKGRQRGSRDSLASDSSVRKMENGGPMSTICVTSGTTELSSVETRLTPSPILKSSSRDLRLLVIPTPQEVGQPCCTEPSDFRPPLPPKTSKLSTIVATETQPLLSTHLISGSHGTLTRTTNTNEEALKV